MVIIIGNQKGGAGKSTLTLLLANFLTQNRKQLVTVIDMAYQQSLVQMSKRDKVLDNPGPYQVISGVEHESPFNKVLFAEINQMVLIDLSSKMDDDRLISLFKLADLIVCPFAYDAFSFESTLLFAMVVRTISPEVDIVFVPMRITAEVDGAIRHAIHAELSRFGKVTPAIADKIGFQGIDTFHNPSALSPFILPALEILYQEYLQPGESYKER